MNLERVLRGEADSWTHIDPSADQVLQALERVVSPLSHAPGKRLDPKSVAVRRAVWIADRLSGESCPTWVRDLRYPSIRGEQVYVIGKRDPSYLASIPGVEIDAWIPQTSAAWVSAHESSSSVLDWYEHARSIGCEDALHCTLPIEEYCRGDPDTGVLAGLVESEADIVANTSALLIVRNLLPNVNLPVLGPADVLRFVRELCGSDIAGVIAHRVSEETLDALCDEIWLASAGVEDLPAIMHLVDRPLVSDTARTKLIELIPPNRPELWHRLLRRGRQDDIACYCQWVSPSHIELLDRELQSGEDERAACALFAMLHKSSRDWRPIASSNETEAWMAREILRYLNPHSELRPPPVLHDVRHVEHDFRLADPFNVRSF